MNLAKIFDAANPLIVSIDDASGVWQIQPSDKVKVNGGPHNGKNHRDICNGRGGDMKPFVIGPWTSRRAAGAPMTPTFFSGDHVPIVLTNAEQAIFVCGYPFTIWVDRDPLVSSVTGSPQNPFLMRLPVNVSGQVSGLYTSAPFTVQPTQQIFHKCTAYVDLGGQTIVVDPDMIIDF